jgi:hypothetical protein
VIQYHTPEEHTPQYFTHIVYICLWSISASNFICLSPVIHQLLPSNQNPSKNFTWPCCYFTFYKNITLMFNILLKWHYLLQIDTALNTTFFITTHVCVYSRFQYEIHIGWILIFWIHSLISILSPQQTRCWYKNCPLFKRVHYLPIIHSNADFTLPTGAVRKYVNTHWSKIKVALDGTILYGTIHSKRPWNLTHARIREKIFLAF